MSKTAEVLQKISKDLADLELPNTDDPILLAFNRGVATSRNIVETYLSTERERSSSVVNHSVT